MLGGKEFRGHKVKPVAAGGTLLKVSSLHIFHSAGIPVATLIQANALIVFASIA
jgi:hypothetical protein